MPQALGTLLAPLLAPLFGAFAGQVALSADGETTADEGGQWLQHVWPHDVQTREELIARLCGRSDYSAALSGQMKAFVRALEKLAAKPGDKGEAIRGYLGIEDSGAPRLTITPDMARMRDELDREEPGRFDALIAAGHWPHMAVGLCMEPQIDEGSLLFSHGHPGIQKGDLVAYAAQGLPIMGAKVFLGEIGDKVFFWCNQPATVFAIDYAHLIHVCRISFIKQPGKPLADARDFDFRSMVSATGQMALKNSDSMPFIAPKERSITHGVEKALTGICTAIQALPTERRSWLARLQTMAGRTKVGAE